MRNFIFKNINNIVKIFLEVFIVNRVLRSKLKTRFAKFYLKKYISKGMKAIDSSSIEKENEFDNVIWQYWHQGKQNAPFLIQKCFESVEKFENDKKIIVLSFDTIKDYVDLPQKYYDLVKKGKMPLALFSDILRLYLLEKYGGCWIDSTIFLTDKIPNDIMESDFFVFQKDKKTDVMEDKMSCFFIRAKKGCKHIKALKNILENYWMENNFVINYFMFEHISSIISYADILKKEWDKMPYYDAETTGILQKIIHQKFNQNTFEEIKNKTPIHKLSYKIIKKYSNGSSYYDYLIDNLYKKKVSVVIPTLQKNVEILDKLIDSLNDDKSVDEILLIDNSAKGYERNSNKLKVIDPKENIYVNPAWNLGTKLAKNDIVGLLNDDIIISDNFCKNIIHQMTPDMGLVGCDRHFIKAIEGENQVSNIKPDEQNPILQKTSYMDSNYGIAMFYYKSSFYKIPDEIKITYGDVWLYHKNKNTHKNNYRITNQTTYHWGSLSSSIKTYNPICKNDAKLYKKLMIKFKDRLFSYDNIWDCFKIRILGLTFKIPKRK